ncbi:Protodermal factor 1 [Platanthera zijinensis]|uniref:Protodermal factor 1 n=1 Tax=Platanthera zijinensis TaxID=2320716 RepID=A0AAP0BU97_9ASPA
MKKKSLKVALLLFILSVSDVSLVAGRALAGIVDEKNYYSPDPNASSPPQRHSHRKPSCDPPSHGGGNGNGNGTPPTTPSHGGGGYGAPPTTPSHGGGSYGAPPTTPSHDGGNHGASPTTPSHGGGGGGGGGGYYNTPPTTPNSPPITTTTPSPLVPSPPLTTDPNTPPTYTIPSPPLVPEPNTPPFFPFTCNYWFAHPTAIWVLFGYWGTVGQVFGTPAANFPFGRGFGLVQALGNTRGDGYGALLREGTAALLNSMASSRFYFSTQQVRDGFNGAARSEKTAAAQAVLFQKANEGHLKH